MLNNLEGQSKAKLVKIIEEQQAHDVKREAEFKKLKAERDQLKVDVDKANLRNDEYVRWVDRLIAEHHELRHERFRRFGEEEYIIFFDNGEDYPESMVAPVVMGADKFRELFYAREQLRKELGNV